MPRFAAPCATPTATSSRPGRQRSRSGAGSPSRLRGVERPDASMGDRELEALRRHGFGVAYRMLGSVSEAEDVAQEALLRLTRQEGAIDEPAAWMTTVVTRLSINVLRSARVRRESYVGPWRAGPP